MSLSPKNADRRLVSSDQLRLPSPTNKAVNPIRRSSSGVQGHINRNDRGVICQNRIRASTRFFSSKNTLVHFLSKQLVRQFSACATASAVSFSSCPTCGKHDLVKTAWETISRKRGRDKHKRHKRKSTRRFVPSVFCFVPFVYLSRFPGQSDYHASSKSSII